MVFEQAKERVERTGGMRAWREREREMEGMKGGFGGGGGSSWGWDDEHGGGEDGEERMADEGADASPESGTRNGMQREEVEDEVGPLSYSLTAPFHSFVIACFRVAFLRSVAPSLNIPLLQIWHPVTWTFFP